MKLNRLANNVCYLIGPIDYAVDQGTGWRRNITKFLVDRKIIVLDPTNKPKNNCVNDEIQLLPQMKKWRENEEYDKLTKIIKQIRHFDLRCVDLASFTITYLDLDIVMCGTWEELFWCNRLKKPCLVMIKQSKQNTPNWLFGTIPHQYIFSTWKELKNYIAHIDESPKIDDDNRWVFFE